MYILYYCINDFVEILSILYYYINVFVDMIYIVLMYSLILRINFFFLKMIVQKGHIKKK